MRKMLTIVFATLALVVLSASQTDNKKTWYEFEGCTKNPGIDDACFFFMEDKETHTRCYAFRVLSHDGAAISCVKQ